MSDDFDEDREGRRRRRRKRGRKRRRSGGERPRSVARFRGPSRSSRTRTRQPTSIGAPAPAPTRRSRSPSETLKLVGDRPGAHDPAPGVGGRDRSGRRRHELGRRFYELVIEPKLRERFIREEVEKQVHANLSQERRELEGEHARSLEQLSASIAHEIRNPITAAKSLVQQMERGSQRRRQRGVRPAWPSRSSSGSSDRSPTCCASRETRRSSHRRASPGGGGGLGAGDLPRPRFPRGHPDRTPRRRRRCDGRRRREAATRRDQSRRQRDRLPGREPGTGGSLHRGPHGREPGGIRGMAAGGRQRPRHRSRGSPEDLQSRSSRRRPTARDSASPSRESSSRHTAASSSSTRTRARERPSFVTFPKLSRDERGDA